MAYPSIAGVFAGLAGLAGAGFAVARALDAWRSLRGFRRAVGAGLAEVGAGLARAEARAAELPEQAAAVREAQERLGRALRVARLVSAEAAAALAPAARARALLVRR